MNLIILTEKDVSEKNIYTISDERFVHLKKILKSEINDVLEVGILNGPTGLAKIISLNEFEADLEIVQLKKSQQLPISIDLICALPRPQTLKKVLQTCATMGIGNLHLIRSEKVENSFFHSPLLEEKKYTKYLIDGLSQGKRTNLPKITIHRRFKTFFNDNIEKKSNDMICLIAHPDTKNYLNKIPLTKFNKIILAIGPEGGWNDFEINFMEEKGFINYKLSENILRVENAVTAALAQIELLMNL